MLLWVKNERGEEEQGQGQGRHQLWNPVDESGPLPSPSLEAVCILAAVGISNYSRDYFKIGLA